ncbi:RAD52 motif-containing protein 1 isoform 2-T2 [Pholidichthys leucotaenia]
MEVDVLEFRVPVENNKTLFVWEIQPTHTAAQIYVELFSIFSSFGPLYLLKVSPNAPLHSPGFYALIKFYSAAHASRAQRLTDGQTLFQNTPLKLKELTSEQEGSEDEEEEEGGVRKMRLKLGCVLQVSFPQHGQMSRGVAVMEDSFNCTGPDVLLQKRCRLQRLVRERALVQAFSTVLLILLGNGKVMVEVKQTSDQFGADDTEGVLQVNEVSTADDEEWDLTVID